MNSEVIHVYADGGVINQNPSKFGGSFAWVIVAGGKPGVFPCGGRLIKSGSGLFLAKGAEVPEAAESFCDEFGMESIENNLSEFYAVYHGLLAAKELNLLTVTLCSDNKNALGRICWDYAVNGIPEWLVENSKLLASQFIHIEPVLLNGHPTQVQLKQGFGERGKPPYPTSVHNDWCHRENKRLQEIYIANLSDQTGVKRKK